MRGRMREIVSAFMEMQLYHSGGGGGRVLDIPSHPPSPYASLFIIAIILAIADA
jgi:hypothetical protein